jgi:hypothetical protein
MDRVAIEEFLSVESKHKTPYTNHYGNSFSVGSCDSNGCGRAFIIPRKNIDANGKSIISFNGNDVYMVDGFMLYITHIRGAFASAMIIKNDFTTQPCYVGKVNNYIIVSDSIRSCMDGLRNKIFNGLDNEEDIAKAFVYAHPDYNKEYDWDEMVFWHSLDRTSCLNGRIKFSKQANKTSNSKATPKELIGHMKKTTSKKIAEKMELLYNDARTRI